MAMALNSVRSMMVFCKPTQGRALLSDLIYVAKQSTTVHILCTQHNGTRVKYRFS